ncbi:hypothetical protein GKZ89_07305 [Bacillus mangrovi]|uniref:Uncharacterized protein n=1 Tax=Metabacillus mangrovi TaxID=1491830 RepID=A0A7X2V401_9BACI|nr:hypothetical protein [Metabacillus mangrovi]MTH53217.1 hypothetical protein [Metabacillus mangrovi]
MKPSNAAALMVSLFLLAAVPLFLLAVSMRTGEWTFFLYGLFPSFFAGFTGLLFTLQQIRKEKRA